MAKKSSNTLKISILIAAIIVVAATISIPRLRKGASLAPGLSFTERTKKGNAVLLILGDNFHQAFENELGTILLELPPDCRTYIACSDKLQSDLLAWTAQQQLASPVFHTSSRAAALMKVWARDILLTGIGENRKTIVVAPNILARSKEEARTFYTVAKELFPPDIELVFAPFAFEGGNLIFIERKNTRILLVGKKTIFDNVRYQSNLWTSGWDTNTLVEEMRKFFRADSVVVVGRSAQSPPMELYFERNLDMGMTVVRNNIAVVAQFPFGDAEKQELRDAIEHNHPVIESLFGRERDHNEVFQLLSERLAFVSAEYDYYAGLAADLGLTVHRSPMAWRHVASWMSWTNVLQVGTRLFFPMYPEPVGAAVRTYRDERGFIKKEVQAEAIANEQFALEGYNLLNYEIYEGLGYTIVPIPEYLHYFEGGLHCFVNILY